MSPAALAVLLFVSAFFWIPLGYAVDDVTYEYDDAGRLITVIYGGGAQKITYTYDDAGNRASVVVWSNSPPVALFEMAWVCNFTSITIFVLSNDPDPDSDPLTITSVTQPVSGTVTILGGGTSVRFDAPAVTTAQFDYTISDGNGGSDTATDTVNVMSSWPWC